MNIIEEAGRALYGDEWHGKLADDLDVTPRTLRRMAKGERTVPVGLYSDLARLCASRSHALGRIIGDLNIVSRHIA